MKQQPRSHPVSRRQFACTVTSGALLASALPAAAQAPVHSTASLLPRYQQHVKLQQNVVACWSATLESIFSWHGVPDLPQQEITRQVFGANLPLPSGNIAMLIGEVNRNFKRANGNRAGLWSRINSLDFGIQEFDNGDIVRAIEDGKPCILCTMSHMMVVVSVSYFGVGAATQIVGMRLMDPMLGIRDAHPAEITLPTINPGGVLRFMAIPEFTGS